MAVHRPLVINLWILPSERIRIENHCPVVFSEQKMRPVASYAGASSAGMSVMSTPDEEQYEILLPKGGFEAYLKHGSLTLDLAGILFVEASKHLCEGQDKHRVLQQELGKVNELLTRYKATSKETDGEDALTDAIQGMGTLADTYSPVIAHFSLAAILLVSAAEAFANDVASHVLTGGEANHFDKLTSVGKWLFLPRVMELDFEPHLGEAPLQGFSELVSRRNMLVHPKPHKQEGILKLPEFIQRMGLDPDTGTAALDSVRQLIRRFSLSWKGSYGPDWLYPESEHFRMPGFYIGDVETPARLGRPDDQTA